MNILLIGFMGVGKTTIGRKLARRLGYFFIDMDKEIEYAQKCSIVDIFKYAGEAHFRKLETELLNQLSSVNNTVISTGGGIVTTDGNIELMKNIGKVVYLNTPLDVLLPRLQNDNQRPLLHTEDAEAKIRSLMTVRAPLYEQADHIIDTNDHPPQQVVSQIIQCL